MDEGVAQAALALFERDRAWNAYAIADLDEPLRRYSTVAVDGDAAVLVLRHPGFTAVNTSGPAGGVARVLDEIELPGECHFLVRLSHRAALARRYRADGHEMLRMYATARSFRTPKAQTHVVAERLEPNDATALTELYAEYEESAYHPDQLENGVFYGVRDGRGGLLAAAGTHVVSRRHGVAAVGNIYTRPAERGRGYGRAATTAVVAELLDGVVDLAILNVAPGNAAARRVYDGLGFRVRCRYSEGRARLRSARR